MTLAAVVVFVGCGRSNVEDDGYKRLEFRVDPEQIEAPTTFYSLGGVVFQAPKDWKPVDASALDAVTTGWEHDLTSGVKMSILGVFSHDVSGAICTVSSVDFGDRTLDESLMDELRAAYEAKRVSPSVHTDVFHHGPFLVYQVLVSSEELVHLKAIFDGDSTPTFAVDYVIPKSDYPMELGALESSLGAVSLKSGDGQS